MLAAPGRTSLNRASEGLAMSATTTNDLTTNEQTKLMWFLLVVALGVGLYSVLCLRAVPQVREQAAQVPSLTCDQLIRRGPGGQRYVILTESCLLGDKSVSESDGETAAFDLYPPLYPATLRQPPQPGDLNIVLYLTDEMERRRIRDDRNERGRTTQFAAGRVRQYTGWGKSVLSFDRS